MVENANDCACRHGNGPGCMLLKRIAKIFLHYPRNLVRCVTAKGVQPGVQAILRNGVNL